MRSRLPLLFALTTAGFLASDLAVARAQDEIPLEFGTYAREKDWCLVNRADKEGPDYTEKRAFINLSQTEINWNESVGKITNVSIDARKRINLAVQMTSEGTEKPIKLQLIRKSKKTFALTGVNFYYCGTYQPNPWLGR